MLGLREVERSSKGEGSVAHNMEKWTKNLLGIQRRGRRGNRAPRVGYGGGEENFFVVYKKARHGLRYHTRIFEIGGGKPKCGGPVLKLSFP